MKKVISNIAILTILGTASMIASADNSGGTYVGGQYGLGSYNEEGFDEVNPTAIIGRFGKYLDDNFSIEGRYGIGLQDDSVNVFGIDASLKIDTLFGVYGIWSLDIKETSSVYGLVGYSRAEGTISAAGFGSASSDDSGVSYGVGANIGVTDGVKLNIEYTQYLNKSDFDFSAIGLGAIFSF